MIVVDKKHWLNAVNSPEDIDPTKFIGRKLKVLDDHKKERTIVIEEVLGAFAPQHATKFQVNAKGESYLISMLDFFGQMHGHRFTKEEIEEFDNTILEVKTNPNWRSKVMRKLWTPKRMRKNL